MLDGVDILQTVHQALCSRTPLFRPLRAAGGHINIGIRGNAVPPFVRMLVKALRCFGAEFRTNARPDAFNIGGEGVGGEFFENEPQRLVCLRYFPICVESIDYLSYDR